MSEAFEKWLARWCVDHPNPATELQPSVVWDAARKQALEDAARSCDANAIAYGAMGSSRMKEAARACAVTIRSHAEKGAA